MGSPGAVVSVAAPAAVVLAGGAPQTFTATVIGPENNGVRWSLSPAVGLLSQSGVYTPPAQLASARDVTITATSFADPTRSGSATVTVAPAGSPIASPGQERAGN